MWRGVALYVTLLPLLLDRLVVCFTAFVCSLFRCLGLDILGNANHFVFHPPSRAPPVVSFIIHRLARRSLPLGDPYDFFPSDGESGIDKPTQAPHSDRSRVDQRGPRMYPPRGLPQRFC